MDQRRHAARVAGIFLLLSAVLLALSTVEGRAAMRTPLASIVVALLGIAVLAELLPWQRWPRWATLSLPVSAVALLGVAAATIGDRPSEDALFLVLVFVWAGWYHPPGTSWRLAPLVGALAVVPYLLTGQPVREVLAFPLATVVGAVVGELEARSREQQHRATARAASAERWRAMLLASLAHDVRSPLATTLSSMRFLRSERHQLTSEQVDRLLDGVIRQNERLLGLTGSLLDSDRVSHGGLRLDVTTTSLREVVERACWLTGIDAANDVAADTSIVTDPQRLEQVIANLLTNAARHGRPPIVVDAQVRDASVEIRVRDHGDGLPPDVAAAVGAAGEAASTVPGYGLWIASTLTRALGGSLRCEAAEPGAVFVVELPRRAPAGSPAPPPDDGRSRLQADVTR